MIILILYISECVSEEYTPSGVECVLKKEREALMDLYTATNGMYWRNNQNWGSSKHFCEWYGIRCYDLVGNTSYPVLTVINLAMNNLTGIIPLSIGSFRQLQFLDLQNNEIYGVVPDTIGCLKKLTNLILHQNYLWGTIPLSVAFLPALKFVDLSNNYFNGTIPDQITDNWLDVETINLGVNNLTGTIPSNIGNLSKLANLFLHENHLTGSIPESIGNLTNLFGLIMRFNRISGTLPPSLGGLHTLTELNFRFNFLEGVIPPSIFSLPRLGILDLSGNFLTGTLPSPLSSEALQFINLSTNQLVGPLPAILSTSLKFLDVSTNGFTGGIPKISNQSTIIFVDFSANSLCGKLPSTSTNFKHLKTIDLSSNQLTGTIPAWMSEITETRVYLSYNNFLCPYPNLPSNVNLQTDCNDKIWYRGLFTAVLIFLEFCGFTTTIVGLLVDFAHIYHPSILSFLAMKDFDISKLRKQSDILSKITVILSIITTFEFIISFLMLLLGISMNFSATAKATYGMLFLLSVPIFALLYVSKSLVVPIGCYQKNQKLLITLTSTQIYQILFLWWSIEMSGIGESDTLSALIILLTIADTLNNVTSTVMIYYIQNQFIPLHQLEFKTHLEDRSFGEVWHARYSGIDVTVKRAKFDDPKDRKIMYKIYLHEAEVFSKVCHHPNIVDLVGLSSFTQNDVYIVTEYCDDGNALSYLLSFRTNHDFEEYLRVIIKLCMGICDAMHYLHSHNYAHTELTISNVMVKRGRGMLADFELTKRLKGDDKSEYSYIPSVNSIYLPARNVFEHTEHNFVQSHPSPRSKLRIPSGNSIAITSGGSGSFGTALGGTTATTTSNSMMYDKSTDVYQFGILLWEMLMLRKWTFNDKMNGTAMCLQQLNNHVPRVFVKIIARCWNDEPELRPQFCELLEDFSKLNHCETSTYRIEGEALGFPIGIINM